MENGTLVSDAGLLASDSDDEERRCDQYPRRWRDATHMQTERQKSQGRAITLLPRCLVDMVRLRSEGDPISRRQAALASQSRRLSMDCNVSLVSKVHSRPCAPDGNAQLLSCAQIDKTRVVRLCDGRTSPVLVQSLRAAGSECRREHGSSEFDIDDERKKSVLLLSVMRTANRYLKYLDFSFFTVSPRIPLHTN
ncbi:hypothetical protein KIN20_026055 [Parelaphostrongylus tenuis]|uniref:Uncharacterized protein n=1 Tax=Parelaphostrongylus tenuis TaxID=148309 RepID=A0AAD5MW64_PARTN|nr:hypothetical protein KIN20_026055 [Parelaphostrongylus tenuis]